MFLVITECKLRQSTLDPKNKSVKNFISDKLGVILPSRLMITWIGLKETD
jgi:hypothetical protein